LAPLLLLLLVVVVLLLHQPGLERRERKQASAVKASAELPLTPSSAAAAGSVCPWRCGPQNAAVAALEKRQQSEKLPVQRGGYSPSTVDGSNLTTNPKKVNGDKALSIASLQKWPSGDTFAHASFARYRNLPEGHFGRVGDGGHKGKK
jgi:hypothetical protein